MPQYLIEVKHVREEEEAQLRHFLSHLVNTTPELHEGSVERVQGNPNLELHYQVSGDHVRTTNVVLHVRQHYPHAEVVLKEMPAPNRQ